MASTKRTADPEWQLPYTPRPFMLDFHQRSERFAYMVLHRRAGKTVAAIAELVIRALYTTKKNAQYAYISPFRQQSKAIGWTYLTDMVEGIAVDVKVSELSVTLPNGAKIILTGSDNPDALRGLYLDGAVIDEMADIRPTLMQAVIMPCLLDRKGFLVVMGTPKGRLNQFHTYYELARDSEDWFFKDMKWFDTDILPREELEHLKASVSEAKFQQEFENSFSAELTGTYYAAQVNKMEAEGRLVKDGALYDANLTVKVAMDIGRGDSTVIWFWQEASDGIRVIECYSNNGEQAQHYIDYLLAQSYTYSNVWLPHDARAKTFATNKSALEQFLEGFSTRKDTQVAIVPSLSVEDGIEAVRQVLSYTRFDYTACYEGIEALRVYRKRWDETNQCFAKTPLHDFSSDFADAARYMAIVARKNIKPAPAPYSPTLISAGDRTAGSLAEMFKANEKKPKGSFARHRV